jgi:hypothetical protein
VRRLGLLQQVMASLDPASTPSPTPGELAGTHPDTFNVA